MIYIAVCGRCERYYAVDETWKKPSPLMKFRIWCRKKKLVENERVATVLCSDCQEREV